MLRIAQICIHSCPLRPLGSGQAGGMNLYVRQISQELARRGHRVDIFTRWHHPSESEVISLGGGARLFHIQAGPPEDISREELLRCLPQLLSGVSNLMPREGPGYDIVHSHYWVSTYVAQQLTATLKIPHVVTFHTLGAIKNLARPAEQEPELRIQAEREAAVAADRIIAFSPDERAHLLRSYGASPHRVKVIPAGVDLNLFQPRDKGEARHELGIGEQKLLLFVGRLQPFKGIDLLIQSLALLELKEDIRLLIVGGEEDGGSEVSRLRSWATQHNLGEQVVFLGTVDHAKLPWYYNAADICIVPSYHESFSLVALESLACATPVVASAVGGLRSLIDDGRTGYLIHGRDPGAFARRLELLLSDEGLRRRLGAAGRASAEKYSWAAIAERILEVYQTLGSKVS